MGRQRSTPDEQKKLGWLIHRRDKPLRRLGFFARSDMFGSNVRGLWPFCSPLVERWDPAIALLSLRKSAFCFPEDPGRCRGSSGEAAEGVSRGMKRILRAWRAARKALLFEGFRGLWDRIRCGRKSGLVRLPRLGSRVRIPSPAPTSSSKSVCYAKGRVSGPSLFWRGQHLVNTERPSFPARWLTRHPPFIERGRD